MIKLKDVQGKVDAINDILILKGNNFIFKLSFSYGKIGVYKKDLKNGSLSQFKNHIFTKKDVYNFLNDYINAFLDAIELSQNLNNINKPYTSIFNKGGF
jgi:hypothetical protein